MGREIEELREQAIGPTASLVLERRRKIEEVSAQLAERVWTIEAQKAQLAGRDRELETLREQIAGRDNVIAALKWHLTVRDATIHSLGAHLDEIHGSLAWKGIDAWRRARAAVASRGGWGALVWKWRRIPAFVARKTRKVADRAAKMARPGRPALIETEPGVEITGESEAEAPESSDVPIGLVSYLLPPVTPPYQVWLDNNRWNESSLRAASQTLRDLPARPLFSVVMPVYNTDDCWLEKAVASVQAQVYPHWELCIADDASTAPNVRPLLRRLAAQDPRIKVRYLLENGNISLASNAAAEIARGEYLVLLDHDDELTPDCLLELAATVVQDPAPDLVYSDDDKTNDRGERFGPQFKSDWSPELLLSYMYFSHVFCIRRALFEEVGGFRAGFEGCQDYDLALRLTERTDRIAHIPRILYHWRALPTSTASSGGAKPEAFEWGRRAVREALDRRGIAGGVSRPDFAVTHQMGLFQIDFPEDGPAVAILIRTSDRPDRLRTCIQSILEKTTYRNYQVIVIDDPAIGEDMDDLPASCRRIRPSVFEDRGNVARLLNRAVEHLDHEFLLFLDAGTEVHRPEWLGQMVGYAQVPGVGVVGARLLDPDGRVRHAGAITGLPEGRIAKAFEGLPGSDLGYLALATTARNVGAVTGACLLVHRERFRALEGFDAERLARAYYDLDFCLRMREAGGRCVYAPRAELIQHERPAVDDFPDPSEAMAFRRSWGGERDPYYNPNLSHDDGGSSLGTRRASAQVVSSELPVRVLFCTHNLGLEGAPLYVYKLATGLQARGRIAPEVHSPHEGPLAAMYREAGIPVHRIDFHSAAPDPHEGHASTIRMFADWMLGGGFDVVHANTLHGFAAIGAAHQAKIPTVWTVHESADFRTCFLPFGPAAVEPALRAFTHPYRVIFVADATRALYKPLETRHNFRTIHQGLERDSIERFLSECSPRDARERIGCPQDKVVITIIGTVCERKGQQVFAAAALELLREGRSDVIFQIVGGRPDSYNDELELMIRDHKAEIRLVPMTPDVHMYYRASDIFVCCSNSESYPTVILEAMAFRLTIVTTPVFGIAEQVRHGVSALTFPPGDVATLVGHLRQLLDDPAERRRLADAANTTLETIISHEEMIEAYEEMFLEAFVAGAKDVPAEPERELREVA